MSGEARPATPSGAGRTVDAENPWPGLAAFREEDEVYFRGRRGEAEALLLRVKLERLTVVFGKSGLGKTSLLLAGLFPRLREENVLPVYLRLDYSPQAPDLRAQVRETVLSAAEAAAVEAPAARDGETLWEYFHRRDADFWNARNRPVTPLLAFDQFEEVFTLGKEREDAGALIDALGELIEGRPPPEVKARLDADPKAAGQFSFGRHGYKVLLSLREDFLPDLEDLRDRIRPIVQNRLRLEAMSGEAAFEVVTGPRELITDEVADRVIRFVAAEEDASLPRADLVVEPALLSVVCRELNNRRLARGEPRITAADLEHSKAEILDDLYRRNVRDVAPEMRAFVEEKLVTVDGYRNTVALEDALSQEGVTRGDVDRLVDRRLLRVEPRRGLLWLELTHDLLTGVVVSSRDARRRVEAAEVAEAARREAEEREQKAREELRRTRRTAAVLVVLLAVAALAVVWALFERAEAQRQRAAAESATELASLAAVEARSAELVATAQTKRAETRELEAQEAERLAVASAEEAQTARQEAERNARTASDLREAAFARQLAAQAEAVLARPGETLELGTLLAIESLRRRPAVEADEALRNALARLPLRVAADRVPLGAEVQVLALAPGGERLVAVDGGRIVVLDSASGELMARLPIRPQHAELVAFNGDGTTLALGGADRVTVWRDWDASSPTRVAAVEIVEERREPELTAVAVSADGRHLATGNRQTVATWKVASESALASFRHPNPAGVNHGIVRGLAFSPDGRHLASANGSQLRPGIGSDVKIWQGWTSPEEAREVGVLPHDGSLASLAYGPEGRFLVTADGTGVHVWDLASGQRVNRLATESSDLYGRGERYAISPDGAYLATMDDGVRAGRRSGRSAVHLWKDWRKASVAEAARMVHPVGRRLETFSFDRDGGRLVTLAAPVATLTAPLAGDWGRMTWETKGYREVARVSEPAGRRLVRVAVSPNGEFLATVNAFGSGGQIWSLADGQPIGEPIVPVSDLAFSPDGELLAAATHDGVELLRGWRTPTPEAFPGTGPAGRGRFLRVAFSADGAFLLVRTEDNAMVWDVERREESFSTAAEAAALAPSARYLAVADGRGRIDVWDLERRARALEGLVGSPVLSLSDGLLAASISDAFVLLWRVPGGAKLPSLQEDGRSLAFSPDGRYLAMAVGDRDASFHAARVWNLAARRPVASVRHAPEGGKREKPETEIHHVAFSPDGRYLATASSDGTARVWLWRPEDLIAESCRRLTRNLSEAEWNLYLGEGEPYRETCPDLPVPER